MNRTEKITSSENRHSLLTLCRFLAVRITHRFMLLALSVTGLLLTALNCSQFAPYGIALLCLLLPSFISGSAKDQMQKKENSELPLYSLYKRYHYSPVLFNAYRITLVLCMLLLLAWYKTQQSPLILKGLVPLVFLALCLSLVPILSRILFFHFHRRLMNGRL